MNIKLPRIVTLVFVGISSFTLSGLCYGKKAILYEHNMNMWLQFSDVSLHVTYYDGITNDLLTAGFGQSGLPATVVPIDPDHPTPQEIRTISIINQYPGVYDMLPSSGWGRLYGPAVPTEYANTENDGKIAGKEYVAHISTGNTQENITVLVKLPDSFNPNYPCIVAFPPGGTASADQISTADWGLKNHCAVVHTDKGAGNSVHDLQTDTATRVDGTRGTTAELGKDANFIAQGTEDMNLAAYTTLYPNRIAIKHAHSQQNPESKWGEYVLQSIEFTFYVLNRFMNNKEKRYTPKNTLVIAAGISNGGGASLRAVEQDSLDLIDGAVIFMPNVNPHRLSGNKAFSIQQGDSFFQSDVHGRPMLDYQTYSAIYQPCASANTTVVFGSLPAGSPGRCAALYNKGLLNSSTLPEQIKEAQTLLNNYGLLESANHVAHLYNAFNIGISLIHSYASAYGRFSVVDNLCGFSYANSIDDGPPVPKTLADLADDFYGILAPPLGTNLISNAGNNGLGQSYLYHTDAQGNADQDLDGMLCLRQLVTGTTGITANSGDALTGDALKASKRVQNGLAQTIASGNLRGKPVIMIGARDDALLPINFTTRSYYGLNQRVEGARSKLAYIEITHTHHMDSFGPFLNDTEIPVLAYLNEAMDRMYAHLVYGTPMPRSQVLPTIPLGFGGGDMLKKGENLPYMDSSVACPITFDASVLSIPECSVSAP